MSAGRMPPTLPEEVHDQLLEILGVPTDLDSSSEFRDKVERVLDEHTEWRKALDHCKRGETLRAAVAAAGDAVDKLLDVLEDPDVMNALLTSAFTTRQMTHLYLSVLPELDTLREACHVSEQDLSGIDGRHRRTENARGVVLAKLLLLSRTQAPEASKRQRRDFCGRALKAAGIPAPSARAFDNLMCRVEGFVAYILERMSPEEVQAFLDSHL